MIRNEEINNLKENARTIAMMMTDSEIEKVIVEFVEEKLGRDKARRRSARCEKGSSRRPR
jgi:hypothetical protein